MLNVDERNISFYIDSFHRLKRAKMKGMKAPHKPLLLLAIMKLIEDGVITDNRVELSDALIRQFNQLWKEYVDDGCRQENVMLCEDLQLDISSKYPFKCSIENPFYYMQYEPFWELVKSPAYVPRSSYTITGLKKCFLYAEIDEALFSLMQDTSSRTTLRNVLLGSI